ncbi:MAG TPA: ATP-binding cassette domain-containing protein [Terracidiphilus sp.]
MLEFAIDSRRGRFQLQLSARFTAPWTVIFGPSGAGKSTLLRLLAGLDRGSIGRNVSARISYNDVILADSVAGIWLSPGRRQTALVTQQAALFPHLTVRANVAYGLPHLDRHASNQRVKEMLKLVDGIELMDRHPRSLSGGEAQRVALARALVIDPKLLLLDEPFSALDGPGADALLDRLQQWVRQHNIQTVIATHEAADAFAIGAEVTLLAEGRLIAQGPAQEVLAKERERITARLADPSARL